MIRSIQTIQTIRTLRIIPTIRTHIWVEAFTSRTSRTAIYANDGIDGRPQIRQTTGKAERREPEMQN